MKAQLSIPRRRVQAEEESARLSRGAGCQSSTAPDSWRGSRGKCVLLAPAQVPVHRGGGIRLPKSEPCDNALRIRAEQTYSGPTMSISGKKDLLVYHFLAMAHDQRNQDGRKHALEWG